MRNQIHQLVAQIAPHDALEAQHIANTLHWIESGVEIFRLQKPDVPNKHLNTYCFLWDPNTRMALFGDHVKSNLWLPGGGHVEPGEHPKDTVTREVHEEFGLKAEFLLDSPCFLTVTETVGPTSGHVDVGLWFLLRGDSSRLPSFDASEFRSIKWCTIDEVIALPSDLHMARFIDKMSLS
jgi:8-oxo-dGTP diphosphatase